MPAPLDAFAQDAPVDASAIAARVAAVRERIAAAAVDAGREPDDVTILLATKTQPPAAIAAAIMAGCPLIGENRVQEIVAKESALHAIPHVTHFIGRLQPNKINQLLGRVSCVQTVDSEDLARKLDARLEVRAMTLDVLVQVNVSGEPSKAGVPPGEAPDLLAAVADLPRLAVRGFMTVGLNSPDRAAVRAGYRRLAAIRDAAVAAGAARATELSMGMSGDLADAIAEGATMVRLGSAIFGPRPTVA